jgi:phenylacetate-CoA ligase
MRRMEKVIGRSDDMIILRGVNAFPTQIEELLLEAKWSSGHYQIELTRTGLMDEATVHAEANDEHWGRPDLQKYAERLVARIKSTIGVSTRVQVHEPGSLPRSLTGKAIRVVDNRPAHDR